MPDQSDNQDEQRQGYRGEALALLQRHGAKVGQRISVETKEGLQTTGLLLPRYEHADSTHIVLKLKSGYNIGLDVGSIKSITVVEESRPAPTRVAPKVQKEGRKRLLLLSTGGTIASRVDYRTGAVHPALSAADLYSAVPELDEIAAVTPEVVFSVYSENISPKDWQKLSERIIEAAREDKPDGIAVMIGTDTLAYVSAALSFSLIGCKVPVVFVGAQRSSDRPSSDAALNLLGAARFAVDSETPGVFVAMHNSENDDYIAIHNGSRVRKNQTSRRDAFESIDIPPIASVKSGEIAFTEEKFPLKVPKEYEQKSKFDPRVALVKFHPGFDPSILDHLVEKRGVRGIIIEGSGLGHVSSETVTKISELTQKGVFVGMCSQCIWGHVDMNVYDTGRDLIAAGAVSMENMLSETALVKLSWAVANFEDLKRVMQTNLVGEMTARIQLPQA